MPTPELNPHPGAAPAFSECSVAQPHQCPTWLNPCTTGIQQTAVCPPQVLITGRNFAFRLRRSCLKLPLHFPRAPCSVPGSASGTPSLALSSTPAPVGMLQGQVLQGPTVLPAPSALPVPPIPPGGFDRDFLWGIQTPRASPWAGKEWPKAAAAPQDLKFQHLLGLCLFPLCCPINPPISVLSGV